MGLRLTGLVLMLMLGANAVHAQQPTPPVDAADEPADDAPQPPAAQGKPAAKPAKPTPVAIPLPPVRPFDLDPSEWLPDSLRNPPKNNPAAAAKTLAAITQRSEEEEEWPRRGRSAAVSEPTFNPNEKPDKPGLSTDPGTSVACVPAQLMRVLQTVILRYGHVRVTSTWRPAWRARRRSYHRRCEAVDFRVPGVSPQTVMAFIRDNPDVGGRKVYWNGLLHIDTGPVRSW